MKMPGCRSVWRLQREIALNESPKQIRDRQARAKRLNEQCRGPAKGLVVMN